MLGQPRMAVIVISFDRRLLERAVHAFDLAIGPRMVGLCEAMLDPVLPAAQRERMRRVWRLDFIYSTTPCA